MVIFKEKRNVYRHRILFEWHEKWSLNIQKNLKTEKI